MEGDSLPVEAAEQHFKDMLKQASINLMQPDTLKIWGVFKAFAHVAFASAEDGYLFECGMPLNESDPFYLNFTRQFTVEENGEYDHLEQLTCHFTYQRDNRLETLHVGLWSFGFANMAEYFAHVERLPEFIALTSEHIPIKVDIFRDYM